MSGYHNTICENQNLTPFWIIFSQPRLDILLIIIPSVFSCCTGCRCCGLSELEHLQLVDQDREHTCDYSGSNQVNAHGCSQCETCQIRYKVKNVTDDLLEQDRNTYARKKCADGEQSLHRDSIHNQQEGVCHILSCLPMPSPCAAIQGSW